MPSCSRLPGRAIRPVLAILLLLQVPATAAEVRDWHAEAAGGGPSAQNAWIAVELDARSLAESQLADLVDQPSGRALQLRYGAELAMRRRDFTAAEASLRTWLATYAPDAPLPERESVQFRLEWLAQQRQYGADLKAASNRAVGLCLTASLLLLAVAWRSRRRLSPDRIPDETL